MRGYWWVPHSDLLTGGPGKKEEANERQRHRGYSPVPLAHRRGNGARLGVLGNLRNRGGAVMRGAKKHFYAALCQFPFSAAEASLWVGVDFLTWHDYYDTEEEAHVAVDKLNLRCNREWMEKHGELLPVAHPHFYVSSLPF